MKANSRTVLTDSSQPDIRMNCPECQQFERLLLESMVFADRAETALRCFLVTHQHFAGVSDLDEYQALRTELRRTEQQRHEAFIDLMNHAKHAE